MDTQEKIIIYQVFTRLFGNNSLRCKPNGSLEENGCGKMADFTTKALKRDQKHWGATHIWYTGIIDMLPKPIIPAMASNPIIPQ